MTADTYQQLRAAVEREGYGREIEWAESLRPPIGPAGLFREYGWVVVNSGMKNQVAVRIWARITEALDWGRPVASAFGHPGKSAAIQLAWDDREARFAAFEAAEDKLAWCASLPWIGEITKWHLAKNLGVDCAKPDRHLVRVAEAAGEDVHELCARLARETGDRVATVDLVIWRACNLGLWAKGATQLGLEAA